MELLSRRQQHQRKDDATPDTADTAAAAQELPSEAAAAEPPADTPSQLADLVAACEALVSSGPEAKAPGAVAGLAEAVAEAVKAKAEAEAEAEVTAELLTERRREGVTMLQLLRAHRRQRRMWEALRQATAADAEAGADSADGQEGEDVWALNALQHDNQSLRFACRTVQQVQRLAATLLR